MQNYLNSANNNENYPKIKCALCQLTRNCNQALIGLENTEENWVTKAFIMVQVHPKFLFSHDFSQTCFNISVMDLTCMLTKYTPFQICTLPNTYIFLEQSKGRSDLKEK